MSTVHLFQATELSLSFGCTLLVVTWTFDIHESIFLCPMHYFLREKEHCLSAPISKSFCPGHFIRTVTFPWKTRCMILFTNVRMFLTLNSSLKIVFSKGGCRVTDRTESYSQHPSPGHV